MIFPSYATASDKRLSNNDWYGKVLLTRGDRKGKAPRQWMTLCLQSTPFISKCDFICLVRWQLQKFTQSETSWHWPSLQLSHFFHKKIYRKNIYRKSRHLRLKAQKHLSRVNGKNDITYHLQQKWIHSLITR